MDEQIDLVNVVFPDQYGRLAGIKVNAEYFLDQMQSGHSLFEYRHNPFRYDISGSEIEISTSEEGEDQEPKVKLPKYLHLRPDIGTIKEVPWQKKEALVMADVIDPSNGEMLPYAPRNVLK